MVVWLQPVALTLTKMVPDTRQV